MRYAPRFPRQENGREFCDREGTKSLSVFRERRQVYKPPSLVFQDFLAIKFYFKMDYDIHRQATNNFIAILHLYE